MESTGDSYSLTGSPVFLVLGTPGGDSTHPPLFHLGGAEDGFRAGLLGSPLGGR